METAKMTIRIDRAELEKLQKAADQEKRSVNQQVLYYIRKALAERKA